MLVTSDLRDWDSPRPAAATATSTATAALDSDDLEFDLGDLKKSSKPRDPYLFLETVDDESSIDLRNRTRSPAGRKQDMRAEIELDELDDDYGDAEGENGEDDITDGLLQKTPKKPRPGFLRKHQSHVLSPHPLFPPLPTYGPPSTLRALQWSIIRYVSSFLSLLFLMVVVMGAMWQHTRDYVSDAARMRWNGHTPHIERRFYMEEWERESERRHADQKWKRRQGKKDIIEEEEEEEEGPDECPPLEGGRDPVVSDVAYYARRVGLDVETFKVQTEDGFIVTLWHVYNPQEYVPLPAEERQHRGPQVLTGDRNPRVSPTPGSNRRYPVLLMHGLMQSAGAYCSNDDDSLAFFLCKSGYDVWLGNNRCGLDPEHISLSASDPRMWSWNIQHLGVLDLAALMSRVLYETGFEKLGLVCHSQGTTQTFVALAKEQRPELGEHISVFCALAPAAYAGPMLKRIYFRFVQCVPNWLFRMVFGIHAFIPFMITVQRLLPSRLYGTLGYHVFSFLFEWSDARWDRGLRDRMFQFAPVYTSSETMRWWLGSDGFAKQTCILATNQVCNHETEEDHGIESGIVEPHTRRDTAWYGAQMPPVAMWIAGSDDLVDGHRLLRRFRNGREPHVRVVHAKTIDDYEHLDVLWAMDVIEQVGKEVREVLWTTMPEEARAKCRMPRGCGV